MFKIEEWVVDDIRRIRKIPKDSRSPDENEYIKLLYDYHSQVQEFNAILRKLKK